MSGESVFQQDKGKLLTCLLIMHKLSFFNYSAAWFQLGLSRSLSPKSAPNMGWSKCVFHFPEFEAIKALLQAPLHFAADSWPINLELFLSLILEVNYPWCSNHLPRLSYHISPLSSYLHNQTSFQLSFNYLKTGAFFFSLWIFTTSLFRKFVNLSHLHICPPLLIS